MPFVCLATFNVGIAQEAYPNNNIPQYESAYSQESYYPSHHSYHPQDQRGEYAPYPDQQQSFYRQDEQMIPHQGYYPTRHHNQPANPDLYDQQEYDPRQAAPHEGPLYPRQGMTQQTYPNPQAHSFIHGGPQYEPQYEEQPSDYYPNQQQGEPYHHAPGHQPRRNIPNRQYPNEPYHNGPPYQSHGSYPEQPYSRYPQHDGPYHEAPMYHSPGYSPNQAPYHDEEPVYGSEGNLHILQAPNEEQTPPPPYDGYQIDDSLNTPRWCQFSEFGYVRGAYTFGEGIGIRHNYSTLTALFAPLVPYDDYYPFLDLRAHYIKNKRWAANVGGGLRWRDCMTGFIFGANLYYDYRNTTQTDFNQFGFGLEFFTNCFEMRLNAYFPVGDVTHCEDHVFSDYIGPYYAVCGLTEIAQKGVDLEVGHTFWKCPYFSVFGAIGGYYYTDVCGHRHHNHNNEKRWGEKARACINVGSLLSLQARFFHDNHQNSFWQGMAMLSIPLDFCFGIALRENYNRVFTQPVERNEMIVKRRYCNWSSNW
ncbi:hypothetical protein pah_c197o030 [Parachlamydia acanthamoebae str. Hall's coccus]|jgi:hypothetical protein|nr:hypothetical protein pah_c197o030 [Parachlamydia acanthamoebae str. Hall's coccus]